MATAASSAYPPNTNAKTFAMETLSLPPFDYKVKKQSGICLIFDIIRKKYVVLTPEEWVRQHVIHYLIGHKGYAPAAIAVERAVDLYGMSRRFDIVAFGKDGAPRLLIECKAPSVPLTRQVFDQAFRYNIVLSAPYVAVTNGILHYCGKVDRSAGFLFLDDFPPAG